jgi:hypothetical protein
MNFLVPLKVGEETKRAALVFDDEGKKGVLSFDGQHVVSFELQTAGAVSNYFTAEKLTRHYLSDILGIETEPVDTGYTPA